MKLLPGATKLALVHMQQKSLRDEYYNDPVLWAKEVLGAYLWSKQREIVYSVRDNKRTVVRSSNGTGKSYTCGVLAGWWIATRYYRDPMQTIVVTTAPSFPQIKTNVFHEFKMAMAKSKEEYYSDGTPKGEAYQPLPGKINDSGNIAEWKADGSLLALGRKPADNEIITTFQGIHRRNVLFIIDEAGGVPRDIFVAAERMTTNHNAKILAVGNPDKRGSEFYKLFYDPNQSPLWNKIKVSSYDTPSFTGEECPQELLDGMPTPEWVRDNIKAWGGLDDPRVQIAILGEFPDSDETVFFSERIINKAEDTEIDRYQSPHSILGVDLAMHGADESRAYLNEGGYVRLAKAWPGGSATENANIILDTIEETRAEYVNIDSGGIGTPIIERMLELAGERHYTDFVVTMMNGSENSPDVRQWYNNRAYWYDLLRRRMLSGEIDLEVSSDLRKQLTDINYSIWQTGNKSGSILIESKRDMRSRVGYSPDDVDSIVYAVFDPTKDMNLGAEKKVTYETPEDILGGESQMPGYLQAIEGLW